MEHTVMERSAKVRAESAKIEAESALTQAESTRDVAQAKFTAAIPAINEFGFNHRTDREFVRVNGGTSK